MNVDESYVGHKNDWLKNYIERVFMREGHKRARIYDAWVTMSEKLVKVDGEVKRFTSAYVIKSSRHAPHHFSLLSLSSSECPFFTDTERQKVLS